MWCIKCFILSFQLGYFKRNLYICVLEMKAMFPNETGFSVTNLKYMKRWYSFYAEEFIIRHQAVDELQMPETFGIIPWGHHVQIITKCGSTDEATAKKGV